MIFSKKLPMKLSSKPLTEEEVAFSLAIKKWQIIDGNLTYDDLLNWNYISLQGINHTGSGDFSQDFPI